MIQGTHGIERVRGVTGSGSNCPLGCGEVRVGVSDTHANASTRGFLDDLDSTVQLRCDRHYPYMSSRRIPESVERIDRRWQEMFRRMDSAANMADKRALEMNADR